ncbi:tRNA pseudouridine32 synthase/23S rRNA pseudouridine746 synthase [Sphingomonas vulcanisoli]|uniref:tRNA pseudouridine32 synthase/23S rRNA pseudouridine746 synthase n=1 Tax=Sphingomonas vulcanisoli TaxID=1658060 RepID=A0ABX0TVN3_9SPHN|nr:RNA pseudouridine synthase [Sphingomonas vulcanisoli]NIJ09607.1 tRNA pseudouridine32 synthase/23S rRNA pseudouridine746 synthase [Sphingomonas vulcanisoli]
MVTPHRPHRLIERLDILFEDGEAIAISKPAGLAVDRPRDGSPSVESLLPDLRLGFGRPPFITHRIDRDTSGCLVLARNPKALKRVMAAFEEGAVEKTYLAILNGIPDQAEGVIDLPLAKISSREAGWRIIADPNGKPALTHWRKLAEKGERSLILFTPQTGRTHQLRVHAAEGLGLSILGDPVYGQPRADGMMLHAWKISIPREGKPPIAAEAPFPDRFRKAGFDAPD